MLNNKNISEDTCYKYFEISIDCVLSYVLWTEVALWVWLFVFDISSSKTSKLYDINKKNKWWYNQLFYSAAWESTYRVRKL